MANERILYRSEEPFGMGYRDIVEVIRYETFEMGNTDIIEYFYENYNLALGTSLVNQAYNIINDLSDTGKIEYLTEEQQFEFCRGLVDALNKYYNKSLKYCLWLAEKDTVINLYEASPESVEAYPISEFMLSDIGEDGKLFAYEELPKPFTDDYVQVTRCKNCIYRYFKNSDYGGYICERTGEDVTLEDYCSFASKEK